MAFFVTFIKESFKLKPFVVLCIETDEWIFLLFYSYLYVLIPISLIEILTNTVLYMTLTYFT